jgi:hypothetical protein
MADTICTGRDSTRGMERESRRIVGNIVFLSPHTTDSPAVLYSHFPVSRYLFMRKGLLGWTPLSEGGKSPVNSEMVRLFLGILVMFLAERPHEELDIVLGNAGGDAGHSTLEPATVVLMIVTEGGARPNLLLPIKSSTDGLPNRDVT